ncbi:MAG: hypothetical protein V4613_03600 [Bacteroidota bacterium]
MLPILTRFAVGQKLKSTMNKVGTSVKSPRSYLPLFVAVILLLFFMTGVFKKLINKYKAWKVARDTKNGTVNVPNGTYNVPTPTGTKTMNLYLVAQSIYDACYNNDWFGSTEDEQGMIDAIKPVPKNLINQLADEYLKITKKGRSMQADFIKYISKEDLKKAGVWDLIN